MPVYEFKCNNCGKIHGDLRKVGDFTCKPCPHCGSIDCVKVFSMCAGSAKGGGSCSGCTSHNCSSCH